MLSLEFNNFRFSIFEMFKKKEIASELYFVRLFTFFTVELCFTSVNKQKVHLYSNIDKMVSNFFETEFSINWDAELQESISS